MTSWIIMFCSEENITLLNTKGFSYNEIEVKNTFFLDKKVYLKSNKDHKFIFHF